VTELWRGVTLATDGDRLRGAPTAEPGIDPSLEQLDRARAALAAERPEGAAPS
jgi:hypothetical protein